MKRDMYVLYDRGQRDGGFVFHVASCKMLTLAYVLKKLQSNKLNF